MTSYRLYLYRGRDIGGREDFESGNDTSATRTAELIFEACSDRCSAWEVWQGVRRVAAAPEARPMRVIHVTEVMQQSVLDTEERILNSKWAVASSQRLLERYAELQTRKQHCAIAEALKPHAGGARTDDSPLDSL
jgi:hypothetical protein